MKTLIIASSILASTLVPAAATAQAVPGAVIAVVDIDRITADCNACKTAAATLQGQVNALKSREQSLSAPLQAEGKSIQTAIDALPKGTEPGAALQARIKAFDTKRQQGAQELSRQQTQIQRNQAYISQQIQTRLGPIYQQVMQRRGANLMVEVGSTLATGASLDVTADVLAALNAALPSVQTTAPAQAEPPASR